MGARRTRGLLAGSALLTLALMLSGCGSGDSDATDGPKAGQPATAAVRKGNLEQTVTSPGTLGFGASKKILSGLPGTITGLPKIGATIGDGDAVYNIDTRPVVRFTGTLPAWRALGPGVTDGADVKQLEAGLAKLGYGKGLHVDDHWTEGTTAAVKAWQKQLKVDPTGTVALGQVLFTPTPLRVETETAAVGDLVAAGGEVLTASGTDRVVTASIDAADKSIARAGGKVGLVFPDGRTATGTIEKMTFLPGDKDSNKPDAIQLTVKLPAEKWVDDELDDTSVTVKLTKVVAKDALLVPVTALVPMADGGYGVQKVTGSKKTYVTVVPGEFSDTDVAVTSEDLKAGDQVVVPS